uniref:Uncharacterized protein n=1 Tax=Rhizophora mucronata TaxID=61149 RepID=A0A2P2MYA3_RHIMU
MITKTNHRHICYYIHTASSCKVRDHSSL